jgi:predicted esterase
VLFRAMVPFVPELIRNFGELSIFIAAGMSDPIVPREQIAELISPGDLAERMFRRSGIEASTN